MNDWLDIGENYEDRDLYIMRNISVYMQEQEEILLACLIAGVNRADISIYVQRLNFTEVAIIVIGGHEETVELKV